MVGVIIKQSYTMFRRNNRLVERGMNNEKQSFHRNDTLYKLYCTVPTERNHLPFCTIFYPPVVPAEPASSY